MRITVNSNPIDLPLDATLADLKRKMNIRSEGTAIAINNRIVPAGSHSLHRLKEGDNVVIISGAYGG